MQRNLQGFAAASMGRVYLVGAGPGDPGLITVRGLQLLRSADVVVHDRLVGPELLAYPGANARIIAVEKHGHGRSTPQEEINELLILEARAGNRVVRLKGGDPFVFGRGAEEALALREAQVPFEVVPGVSSAFAVPAAAGIPLTHRTLASGFAVVTGHLCQAPDGQSNGGNDGLDWDALSRMPTLVVLMGLRSLPKVVSRLCESGRAMDTPAAVISHGTLLEQQVVVGTLASITVDVAIARLQQPATLIVGDVVTLAAALGDAASVASGADRESVPALR